MAKITIGKRVFELKAIPAMKSFRLQPLLAPAAAHAMGLIMATAAEEGDTLAEAIEAIEKDPARLKVFLADAGNIIGTFKPADLDVVTRELLAGATCDGVPLWPVAGDDAIFDAMFAGRTKDLWGLLGFAVKENYPDFFRGGAASAESTEAPSLSGTSTTSPGDGRSTGSSPKAG